VTDGPDGPHPLPAPGADRRPPLRVVGPEAYADWNEIYADNVVWVYRLL
jgi:hypothetical protein